MNNNTGKGDWGIAGWPYAKRGLIDAGAILYLTIKLDQFARAIQRNSNWIHNCRAPAVIMITRERKLEICNLFNRSNRAFNKINTTAQIPSSSGCTRREHTLARARTSDCLAIYIINGDRCCMFHLLRSVDGGNSNPRNGGMCSHYKIIKLPLYDSSSYRGI